MSKNMSQVNIEEELFAIEQRFKSFKRLVFEMVNSPSLDLLTHEQKAKKFVELGNSILQLPPLDPLDEIDESQWQEGFNKGC